MPDITVCPNDETNDDDDDDDVGVKDTRSPIGIDAPSGTNVAALPFNPAPIDASTNSITYRLAPPHTTVTPPTYDTRDDAVKDSDPLDRNDTRMEPGINNVVVAFVTKDVPDDDAHNTVKFASPTFPKYTDRSEDNANDGADCTKGIVAGNENDDTDTYATPIPSDARSHSILQFTERRDVNDGGADRPNALNNHTLEAAPLDEADTAVCQYATNASDHNTCTVRAECPAPPTDFVAKITLP